MIQLSKYSDIDCSDLFNRSGAIKTIEIKEKIAVKLASTKVVSEEVIFEGSLTSGFEFIKVDGSLKFTIEMECARCLELVNKDCISALGAVFTKDNDDETLSISESLTINLEGLVADNVTDSMNMKYICSIDCLGLCYICGDNRNHSNCGHTVNENKKNSKDNPFSSLNELNLKVE